MLFFEILLGLYFLGMVIVLVWQIVCLLFVKRGHCKFTRCPFRKEYFPPSCLQPDFGCDKCPPTEKEMKDFQDNIRKLLEELQKDGSS